MINRLAYDLGSPKRFDIAAFSRDDSSFNIRRVIGLPGETVQIIEGMIYIDGEPLAAEEESLCSASMAGLAEYPVELGEDEYFLLEITGSPARTAGLRASEMFPGAKWPERSG